MSKSFNKVIIVGRLTRDCEVRSFGTGGKVAKLGVAVNNSKKDASGSWVDDPCFLDVECFNSQYGQKLADIVEQYTRKGSQILVEGRLVMDAWDDKNSGAKRTKLKIVAETVQLLGTKDDNRDGAKPQAASANLMDSDSSNEDQPAQLGAAEDIPF